MTWEIVVLISVGLVIAYAIFDRIYTRVQARELEETLGLQVRGLTKRLEYLEMNDRSESEGVKIWMAETKRLSDEFKKMQSQQNIAAITRPVR